MKIRIKIFIYTFIYTLAVLFALLGCLWYFAEWCGRATMLLCLAALGEI